MSAYTSKLIKKEFVAQNTMAFYVEKPPQYSYTPGQHTTVRITSNEGVRKERTFSFITVPSEDSIGFTTRMREESTFKNILKDLPEGVSVEISDPRGSMTLPETSPRPIVFFGRRYRYNPFYEYDETGCV